MEYNTKYAYKCIYTHVCVLCVYVCERGREVKRRSAVNSLSLSLLFPVPLAIPVCLLQTLVDLASESQDPDLTSITQLPPPDNPVAQQISVLSQRTWELVKQWKRYQKEPP